MASLDELRKRGIEFLKSQRALPKQEHELSARELSGILGICPSSVYEYMKAHVEAGRWATRMAYDPEVHRSIKVWWLADETLDLCTDP